MKGVRRAGLRLGLLGVTAFLFTGVTQCSPEATKQSASGDLINAFAQGCSQGPWTTAALNRSSSLIAVYRSLLNKASCKDNPNLAKALYSAQQIEAEARAVAQDVLQKDERVYEEATQDLLLMLSQPGLNSDVLSSLSYSYSDARYKLSLARSRVDYQNSYRSRETTGLLSISSHVGNLLAASRELAECYADNPSVAMQVGTGLSELAGSFAPPVIGLGVTAVSNLIKLGVEAARTLPISEAIYETNRATMPSALKCGLEALTRDYCKARSANLLLSVDENHRTSSRNRREPLEFFAGIELQDRHLPVLYQWLDRVVNGGGKINNIDQANKINLQFHLLNSAQAAKRVTEGLIPETQNDLANLVEESSKVDGMKKMLRRLVEAFFECGNGGGAYACPESLYYQNSTPIDFLRKVTHGFPLDNPGSQINGPSDFLTHLVLTSDQFPILANNVINEVARRALDIARDFNSKVFLDTPTLVRDFSRVDREGLSPKTSVEKLFRFLDGYRFETGPNAEADRILIAEFRTNIEKVYHELVKPESISDQPVEVTCPPSLNGNQPRNPPAKCYGPSPAATVIALTYDAFKLDKTNVFLPGKIAAMIATDLNTRFLNHEGPANTEELYRLASLDLNLMLARSGLSRVLVQGDISEGQSVTMKNLSNFRDKFDSFLGQSIADLKSQADKAKEPAQGAGATPNRNTLARLCILTLISGMDWPKGADRNLCQGTKIVSLEGDLNLDFDALATEYAAHPERPFDERVCAYEDFLRAERLAEQDFLSSSHR